MEIGYSLYEKTGEFVDIGTPETETFLNTPQAQEVIGAGLFG